MAKLKNGAFIAYKGYGILKIKGEWRAEAYANPTFYDTNLTKIKAKINQYLTQC